MKRPILILVFVSAVLMTSFIFYCSCDKVSEYNNKSGFAQSFQAQGSNAAPTSTATQGSSTAPASTAVQGSNAAPTSTSTSAQGLSTAPASTAVQASSTAQTSNFLVTPSNVETKTHVLNEDGVLEIQGLVKLEDLDSSFVIDLKYATEDNFTGKVIYSKPLCVIHKKTAKKLIAANSEFKELGYRLKIFDAYRPFSAQQTLWDATDNKSFVANPKKGSIHNRGAAVDVTLVDEAGNEIEMPSGYDEFSERAALDYKDCPKNQIENRELLGRIMVKHGFRRINNEWWHFEDTNANYYPIRDISFEEFEEMG